MRAHSQLIILRMLREIWHDVYWDADADKSSWYDGSWSSDKSNKRGKVISGCRRQTDSETRNTAQWDKNSMKAGWYESLVPKFRRDTNDTIGKKTVYIFGAYRMVVTKIG